MRKSRLVLMLAALAVAVLAIPAISQAGKNTTEVDAKMSGKQEVPGPGSKKGHGDFQIFLKPTQSKVCFNLDVKGLDTITDAHIHKGAEGVAGPVKVPLFVGQNLAGTGNYDGCVKKVKAKLIKKIIAHPEKFYANVHTIDFPNGAIRGQLALAQ
ncbi:MAG: CHRD domain-containing protein [Solirubrobacterales bacterium]